MHKEIKQHLFLKQQQKHRWMVSYIDLLTLLFAFFVVMYGISVVDEQKYAYLAEGLKKKFMQLVVPIETSYDNTIELQPETNESAHVNDESFAWLYNILDKQLKLEQNINAVVLTKTPDWLIISLQSGLLFESGSSVLSNDAYPTLEKIAAALKLVEFSLSIEGFTDKDPVNNPWYSSNWELAGTRAVQVLQVLQNYGINVERLNSVSFGDNYPIADNKTEAGKMKNRRVNIVIERTNERRNYLHNNAILDTSNLVNILQLQEEYTITPITPTGADIKGIVQPSGSIIFNRWGIERAKKE